MKEPLLTSLDKRGVATLTLNQASTHNALNRKLVEALIENISHFQVDSNVRIIVLKSEGASFCAGADLRAMKKMANASLQKNREDAELLAKLMRTLYNSKKPTMSLVQGPTYGGGIGLVACTDIALVSENVTFCFSETKLGLAPAVISPYIIQAIGIRAAKAYFLSAMPFDAHAAFDMGLCHAVVKFNALEATAEKWIKSILQNGPLALKATKRLFNTLSPFQISPEVIDFTTENLAKLRVSDEGQEGVTAFLEKRLPAWRDHGKK
jgi:methylglutaconyl-CoA hydratase